MAIHRIGMKWTEEYESDVYIEADSMDEALKIVKNNTVNYVDKARENTFDGYLGLIDAKVNNYKGIIKEDRYPDNIDDTEE